jgi:serine-type D-Ala-D-Ala carboxypeptidase
MKTVDDMMRRAVTDGVFPGAVLLVSKESEIRFFEAYGSADLFAGRPMKKDTVFDLASLTKPLSTALALMKLAEEKKLSMDQPVGEIIEDLRHTDKAAITVADLLDHTAGLPAWRPYYARLRREPREKRKKALHRLLAREPLISLPGEATLYSDIGFMVLDWVIEAVSGLALDRFSATRLYGPMGIDDLFFPGLAPWTAEAGVAATELCPWRGRLLCGQVHDDNAWTAGGVAGHAGLFGTARGVNGLLCRLATAWRGGDVTGILAPDLVRRFFRPRAPGRRPLGFDAPAARGSAAGTRFGPESVGHLGYTGTSFWMDPRRSIHVILLTNRVHPTRYNTRIRAFRPGLHDEVMNALKVFSI